MKYNIKLNGRIFARLSFLVGAVLICSCLLHTEKAFASSLDASKIVSGKNVSEIQSTDNEVSITLDKTSFDKGDYILDKWFDEDNNEFDDIKVFGQRIDYVQYIIHGDNAYWEFDTEGSHGVIVEISNSKDASAEPVTYEIGSISCEYTDVCPEPHTIDKIPIAKDVKYDTIRFYRDYARCIDPTEQIYRLHPAKYLSQYYVSKDFINEYGEEQDRICPFGDQYIDFIEYIEDDGSFYWAFDIEGKHGLIVEISNSKDESVKPITYEIGSTDDTETWVPVETGVMYDTIRFYKDYARCIKPAEQVYKLHPASYKNSYYVSLNFIDESGEELDKICPFGQQWVDSIQYTESGNNAYWEFDTDGKHGVIVEISNSQDASVKPVTYEIGSNNNKASDKVPVVKGAMYDTIQFYPDYAVCTNATDQTYKLNPSNYLDGYYISWNFINEKGEEQDRICPFGEQWIDWIRYEEDGDEAFWVFDTEDKHGVIVEISNSKDSSVKSVTYEIGSSNDDDIDKIPVVKGEIYDTIRFYPDYAVCTNATDQTYKLHPSKYLDGYYISWNFKNEKGEEQDKICPYAKQWIDSIQYTESGNNAYWEFDTDGKHGVIVEISNSKDDSVKPVTYEIGSSTYENEGLVFDAVPVVKGAIYDTIRFYPDYAVCTNATDQTYQLYPSNHLGGHYISMDFINEKGEEQDKICPFGQQWIDWIRYEKGSDNDYWVFGFDYSYHGIIVEISNSNDKSIKPVTYEIGSKYGKEDWVPVAKGTMYDTIRFYPDYAVCTKATDQTYKLHPAKYLDDHYISLNFINEQGNEQDRICPFGEQWIDWIRYEEDGDKDYWVFDTEGKHGVIVEISNSKDSSVKPVTYEIGSSNDDIDKIPVVKGEIYDTIRFYPDYAVCSTATDQIYKLHPSKYLDGYYISWNFKNEKGEEQDKICPFGEQWIDWIKYEENGDKAKWVFDTEGTHGVYVKIYNSQDPSITPVNALIGANKWHDTDDVQVQKGVIYDTIEFSPYKK